MGGLRWAWLVLSGDFLWDTFGIHVHTDVSMSLIEGFQVLELILAGISVTHITGFVLWFWFCGHLFRVRLGRTGSKSPLPFPLTDFDRRLHLHLLFWIFSLWLAPSWLLLLVLGWSQVSHLRLGMLSSFFGWIGIIGQLIRFHLPWIQWVHFVFRCMRGLLQCQIEGWVLSILKLDLSWAVFFLLFRPGRVPWFLMVLLISVVFPFGISRGQGSTLLILLLYR